MLKTAVMVLAIILMVTLSYAKDGEKDDIQVLMLMGEWFGDTYFTLKERLDASHIKFVRIGVDEKYRGCYNKARDVELTRQILIPDFKKFSEYDCVMIPSGPQFRKFVENRVVLDFIKKAYDSGLVIASICNGDDMNEFL